MKKYLSFFRLRFVMSLQYRVAAIAGIVTQFVWGFMEILMFKAFYEADPLAFPMSFEATVAYIWLQQAFLALFMTWFMENEIFDSIMKGDIAYELCRPIDIYNMWFARSIANRLAKAVLRCMPILIVALCLPKPYALLIPVEGVTFLLMLISLVLALGVTVAFCMLIYITCFFTVSPMGVRMVATSLVEFCQGAVIPLPFFPDKIRILMEWLPFGAMQNVPFRIYSGDIAGAALIEAIGLQVFWLIALVAIGKGLSAKAMKKICVQGG